MRTVSSFSAIDKKGAKTVNVRVFSWCYTKCRYIDSNTAPERETWKRVARNRGNRKQKNCQRCGVEVVLQVKQDKCTTVISIVHYEATRTVKLEYGTNDRSANCGPGSKPQATSGRVCHRVLEMRILGLLNIVRLLLLLL